VNNYIAAIDKLERAQLSSLASLIFVGAQCSQDALKTMIEKIDPET
jgi:hypothetical protein